MQMLIAVVLGVPIVDLLVKIMLRRALHARVVSLGPLGSLRIVAAPLWLARYGWSTHGGVVWALWAVAAGILMIAAASMPSLQTFAGLILGGALSNALESSWRGLVSDYICLKFWPAFNLADVAITIGAVGLIVKIMAAVQSAAV